MNTCQPISLPGGSDGKESCNVGDLDLIPRLGRSPGEGNGYPLQYSGLENSMDCIVHGLAKSQRRLSEFIYFNILFLDLVHISLAGCSEAISELFVTLIL